MKGQFYSEITQEGGSPFVVLKTMVGGNVGLISGNVVQSYLQFQAPDHSFTNIVCTLTYNSSAPAIWSGTTTCGTKPLYKLIDNASSVKDNIDCSTSSGQTIDDANVHEFTFESTNTWAVCTSFRQYNFQGAVDPFKVGENVNLIAGFNIYRTIDSTQPEVQAYSNSLIWKVGDYASVLLVSHAVVWTLA